MVRLSLRMNLKDILENEGIVIEKLNEIHKDSVHFFLKLWYLEGSVSVNQVKEFLVRNESKFHFKTSLKPESKLGPNDFVWFDVIDKENAGQTDRVRFEYSYSGSSNILLGLDEFHKCAKFCTSEKPPKRIQKRNDNESSDYR